MRAVDGRGIEVGGGRYGDERGVTAMSSIVNCGFPGVSGPVACERDVASTVVLLISCRKVS